MAKAVTFATLILACVLLIEAAPATTKINEIKSMCSYYTGKLLLTISLSIIVNFCAKIYFDRLLP